MDKPIVFDVGSTTTRFGFAGDHDSLTSISSAVVNGVCNVTGNPSADVSLPIINSTDIAYDWDALETLISHIYTNDLNIDSENHPVLFSEPVFSVKQAREKQTEIMFELFNVPTYFVCSTATLTLMAAGMTTGIVIESGHRKTTIVPLEDCYPQPAEILQSDISGITVDNYLNKLLSDRGYHLDHNTITDIKHKICHVALNYDTESGTIPTIQYELPDGQVIDIGNERIKATEAFFQPKLLNEQDTPGLAQLVYKSIMKCDVDLRGQLYNKIILSGGSTLLKGLEQRVESEVSKLVPPFFAGRTKVIAPTDRIDSVWKGGSTFASKPNFSSHLSLSKQRYDEFGPRVIHSSCILFN